MAQLSLPTRDERILSDLSPIPTCDKGGPFDTAVKVNGNGDLGVTFSNSRTCYEGAKRVSANLERSTCKNQSAVAGCTYGHPRYK